MFEPRDVDHGNTPSKTPCAPARQRRQTQHPPEDLPQLATTCIAAVPEPQTLTKSRSHSMGHSRSRSASLPPAAHRHAGPRTRRRSACHAALLGALCTLLAAPMPLLATAAPDHAHGEHVHEHPITVPPPAVSDGAGNYGDVDDSGRDATPTPPAPQPGASDTASASLGSHACAACVQSAGVEPALCAPHVRDACTDRDCSIGQGF